MALINGTPGNDFLPGTAGADQIFGGAGNDSIFGGLGNDELHGQAGNDYLYGGDGNDTIGGGPGADWLYGGAGNDVLKGGPDADHHIGGAGADRFVFDAAVQSTPGARDEIMDFSRAEGDKIDFSGFDARANQPGMQHFSIVDQPSNGAGTMWLRDQGDHWAVFVNSDGGEPDMVINVHVAPGTQLTAADFIL